MTNSLGKGNSSVKKRKTITRVDAYRFMWVIFESMGVGGSDRNRGNVHAIAALSFPCNFILCKFLLMFIPNQYSQQAFLHEVWLCWFDCLILFQPSAR